MPTCSYNANWNLSDRLGLQSLRSYLHTANIDTIGIAKRECGEKRGKDTP